MAAKTSFSFLQMALMLSLLVTVTIASRSVGIPKVVDAGPKCDTVYGAQPGDTCFSVAQASTLTQASFLAINPNINCQSIFVGQWLCVAGSPN